MSRVFICLLLTAPLFATEVRSVTWGRVNGTYDTAHQVANVLNDTADYEANNVLTSWEVTDNDTVSYNVTELPEATHSTAEQDAFNSTASTVRATEGVENLQPQLEQEILRYQIMVNGIVQSFRCGGPEINKTYDELAEFVDQFGHRMTGTAQLEEAIDYLVDLLKKAGVDSVTTEPVIVPVWTRGEEKCRIVKPRAMDIDVLGLGRSVPTADGGITARVVLVKTFEELEQRRDEVNGSILLYKPVWTNYFDYVIYRTKGAIEAARLGAQATLIRSATAFSLYTVHTGSVYYAEDAPRIPAAAITVEDADLLERMLARGQEVVLHLDMKNNHSEGISRNIVADIKGTTYPQQFVIAGAHTDSWDVGQGAMDDGGGVFLNVRMAQFLHKYHLRPKRTIRIVLWTAEEVGYIGGRAFAHAHQSEADNISIALESDYGTFTPSGLTTSSRNNVTQEVILRVLKLLPYINATELQVKLAGSDVKFLDKLGVPVSILLNKNDRYFHYHHTKADTMSMMDREALDLCTAMWIAVSYVFADLSEMLPR